MDNAIISIGKLSQQYPEFWNHLYIAIAIFIIVGLVSSIYITANKVEV